MSEPAPVIVEPHDGWAEVVFNRPEVKNAITGPFGLALAESLERVSADPDVRVIVLRGAGGAFCSGLDLRAFNADPAPAWAPQFQSIWRRAHRALFNCRVPVIGALERYAINGGAALALACDLLIVGEGAFLQVGEAKIGMAAPYNLAWLSLRQSENTMAHLTLEGERVGGARLYEMGLAYRSVADDAVLEEAAAIAQTLADYPGNGLTAIKAGLRHRMDDDADAWFDRFTASTGPMAGPSSMRDT